MKKKLVYLLSLAAGVMLAFFTLGGVAQASETRSVTTHKADGLTETHDYQLWSTATSFPTLSGAGAEGYYYYPENTAITLSAAYPFTANNQKLYLDLNGNTLKSSDSRFVIPGFTGCTLVIYNGTIDRENLGKTMWGSVAYLNQPMTLILDSVTLRNVTVKNTASPQGISGESYYIGGAIQTNNASATAYLYHVTFDAATGYGGAALTSNSGKIIVDSCTFKECSAITDTTSTKGAGGAVMVRGGTCEIKNTTFKDCNALFGGAVAILSGTCNVLDSSFENCDATNGGAVSLLSGGTLNLNGGTMMGCQAGFGGAIYSVGTVNINAATIQNCSASDRGGAIMGNGGSITIDQSNGRTTLIGGGLASKNTAANFGGSIHCWNTNLTIKGGEISYGTASNAGGNISFFAQGFSSMEGAPTLLIEGNAVISNGVSGTDSSAGQGGGNIFVCEASQKTLYCTVIVKGNSSVIHGKSFNAGGNINFRESCPRFTLSENAMVSYGEAATHSGNIRLNVTEFTMSGGTISNGIAGTHGGNLTSSGNITMSGGTISDGQASSSNGGGNIYYSGGSGKIFIMNGGTISGGTAPVGGGVVLVGSFEMNQGTIRDCAAKNDAGANGGAIYVSSGTFTMNGGSIENCFTSVKTSNSANYATANNKFDGGAIYISTAASVYLRGGEIKNNYINNFPDDTHTLVYNKQSRGGSIFSLGKLYIQGGKVLNGTVNAYGGNIVISGTSAELNMSAGEISGGVSKTSQCGNIAAIGGSRVVISGGVISGGKATSAGNIGILDANTSMEISGGTIVGGTATSFEGGNIHVRDAGSLTISDNNASALIANGTAQTKGGNIALGNNAVCTISGGTITGGKTNTDFGGNISLGSTSAAGNAKLTISGGMIANGHSKTWGGNIAVRTGTVETVDGKQTAALRISGGTIVGGVAGSNGGNITVAYSGVLVEMSGGYLLGGTANDGGGGNITFNDLSDKFVMTGGVISGGSCTTYGGNICINAGSQIHTITKVEGKEAPVIGGQVTLSIPKWNDTKKESELHSDGTPILVEKTFEGGTGVAGGGSIAARNSTLAITSAIVVDDLYAASAAHVTLNSGYFDSLEAAEGASIAITNDKCYFVEKPAVGLTDEQEAIRDIFDHEGKTYCFLITAKGTYAYPAFTSVASAIADSFQVVIRATKGTRPEGAAVPTLVIVRNGEEKRIPAMANGEYYQYAIALNPEELADNLMPRLVIGEGADEMEIDARNQWNAAENYIAPVAEAADAALKALLAELLSYGAAAQEYYNHNRSRLASDYLTWGEASEFVAPTSEPLSVSNANAELRFRSANLYLENDTISVQFKGIAPEDTTFMIGENAAEPLAGTNFTLKTAPIKMSALADAVFTATAMKGDAVSTVTYSVANYIESKTSEEYRESGNPYMTALAERLWMYGQAAKAYYAAH